MKDIYVDDFSLSPQRLSFFDVLSHLRLRCGHIGKQEIQWMVRHNRVDLPLQGLFHAFRGPQARFIGVRVRIVVIGKESIRVLHHF